MLECTVMLVTPEIAKDWLSSNYLSNRSIRTDRVKRYADEMAAGKWTLNNDALCFTPEGTLINGQHRLSAVIASGKSIEFLVLKGMSEEQFRNIDTGANRSVVDLGKITHPDEPQYRCKTVYAVMNLLMKRCSGHLSKTSVSQSKKIVMLEEYPGVSSLIYRLYCTYNRHRNPFMHHTVMASSIAALMNGESMKSIFDFMKIGQGDFLDEILLGYNVNAAMSLRDTLMRKELECLTIPERIEKTDTALYNFIHNKRTRTNGKYEVTQQLLQYWDEKWR